MGKQGLAMSEDLPMVIIGSGGAASSAVKAIRKAGWQGEIHLFSDSIQPPLNPMLLTYYIGGKIPLENCYLYGSSFDFFKEHRVSLHNHDPVNRLFPVERVITTASGQEMKFGSCLVASGASALVPPVPGSREQRVFSIRTIEEAVRLRELFLDRPRRVVLVGASMVGIKLVEVFQNAGAEVYLVDLAAHVFAQAAHPDCAALMEQELARRGIRLILNAMVAGITDHGKGLKVQLAGDAADLDADLLVFCIGVKPNLDFLRPGDLALDRGILVDDRMRTSAEQVYAAGDVAQGLNLVNRKQDVISLWANACQQGQIAGTNMAGGDAVYSGSLPQNITHFFDIYFVSIGDIFNFDEMEQGYDGKTHAFYFRSAGELVGVNFLSVGNYELINASGVVRHEILRTFNARHLSLRHTYDKSDFVHNFHKTIMNGRMKLE